MNRTDRLLALVLELQAKGWQRAEDLAAVFEISKRTIYRDMQALAESGVPVISQPGLGYALMEGYFLPPLNFAADEAVMLLLGAESVAQQFDREYRQAAERAAAKIAAVLPPHVRADAEAQRGAMRFIAGPGSGAEDERLRTLRRAIVQRRTVAFRYHARHGQDDGETSRTADPYGLLNVDNRWYLVAHCHLRQDRRNFRLDRMEALELTTRTFERRPDLIIDEQRDDRFVTARALFSPDIARWVRETGIFYAVAEEETADGLLVTFRVRREDELVQWLLGWGAAAEVLEPDSLRDRLRREAERMAALYAAPVPLASDASE